MGFLITLGIIYLGIGVVFQVATNSDRMGFDLDTGKEIVTWPKAFFAKDEPKDEPPAPEDEQE